MWFLRSGYCGRGCLHPHVHCIIPAGGLSPDHTHWVKSRYRFFLPINVLRRVFRGKFVAGHQQAFHDKQLAFHGDLTLLAQPKTFAAWLRPLFRKDWVVYSKPPFGGPEYVLQYLGRYTHRVAISNHRLVSFAEGQVTFPCGCSWESPDWSCSSRAPTWRT
ncbi:MAG TPA: transposase [Candidatus Dormibacteraeota bacterium]|nr:transposase [Candidatus Dormibacteraeota bacterium]